MAPSFSILVVISLLLELLCSGAEAQTFKIATSAPDGTVWMQTMRQAGKEIEERTSGRVQFKFYPGGVMGSDKIVLRKMRVRQLQGGAVTSGALAQVYPDSQIYGLPLVLRSFDEVDYVRKRMDPVMLKGLEEHGFIGFGIGESGFAYLMSNKPIKNVEDLRSQKMWVLEGDLISQTFLETAGVSPIPLPFSDVYTALETGLLDAVGSPPMAAIALQWHTRVRYLTDLPLMYTYGMLIVSRDAFRRLSQEDQAVVREVFGRATMDLNRRSRLDNARAKEALRSQGITFVTPSSEALTKLESIAEETNRQLADKGVYSKSLLGMLNGLVRKYRDTHEKRTAKGPPQ
jgi:TRAP-type C4-dicarboxylate transport system substrate-binding protein